MMGEGESRLRRRLGAGRQRRHCLPGAFAQQRHGMAAAFGGGQTLEMFDERAPGGHRFIHTPSLGEIIALLSVVNVSWPSASSAIASEVWAEGQPKAGWLS